MIPCIKIILLPLRNFPHGYGTTDQNGHSMISGKPGTSTISMTKKLSNLTPMRITIDYYIRTIPADRIEITIAGKSVKSIFKTFKDHLKSKDLREKDIQIISAHKDTTPINHV